MSPVSFLVTWKYAYTYLCSIYVSHDTHPHHSKLIETRFYLCFLKLFINILNAKRT